jgi:hypothetical protein
VKFFLGRYVTTFNTVGRVAQLQPGGLLAVRCHGQQGWTDNGDFIANCNFRDPNPTVNAARGNPFFGKQISPLTVDTDTTADGTNGSTAGI